MMKVRTETEPSENTVKIASAMSVYELNRLAKFIEEFHAPELGNLLVALQWHARRFESGEFDEVVKRRCVKVFDSLVSDCYRNG